MTDSEAIERVKALIDEWEKLRPTVERDDGEWSPRAQMFRAMLHALREAVGVQPNLANYPVEPTSH